VTQELDGHVALVSGGSRGIGLGIARAFVARGAEVAITGRSREALDAAVASFVEGSERARVLPLVADAGSDAAAASAVAATSERFGRLDTLVNNAATTARFGRVVNVPLDEWDDVMRVNLRAPLVWSRAAHPLMRAQGGGTVVNIGSSEGIRLTGGLGAYAVSKSALIMLTRVCAREWAGDGIRVNCLAPGVIETEFSAAMVEQIRTSGEHINPLQAIGSPDDVAAWAVLLAGAAGRFVTGAVIAIDGGETA
jgi:NAD(P)-dependent dehydrogenase (short-subunit alcohol dehydrogenase family)